MNINWYYAFVTLANTLNYRKASEILHLTEPSIFKQIQNLETEFQTKLFKSKQKRLQLTRKGKYFLPLAVSFINHHENNIKAMKCIEKEYIDVAISPYIANYLISKFLVHFFKTHPNIELNIHVVDHNIESLVKDSVFEIGISREIPLYKSVFSKKVCEGSISLYAANIEENKSLDEKSILSKYRILSENHPDYWYKLKKSIKEIVPNAKFTAVYDVAVTEKLITQNQGVSYLPDYLYAQNNNDLLKIDSVSINPPISFTYLFKNQDNDDLLNLFEDEFIKYITIEQNTL